MNYVYRDLVGQMNCIYIFADSEDKLDGAILAFALVGKSAAIGSTYICQIFTAELYPTVIRYFRDS